MITSPFASLMLFTSEGERRLCFLRTEIVGRDRSEAADDCAEAEWASKLRELGIPEIDRFANRQYSEIIFGR